MPQTNDRPQPAVKSSADARSAVPDSARARLPSHSPLNCRLRHRGPLRALRDDDLMKNAFVEPQDVVRALARAELGDHSLLCAIEDAMNAAFEPSAAPRPFHANFHALAVHRGAHSLVRNVNVVVGLRERRVSDNETMTVAVAKQPAAHDGSRGLADSRLGHGRVGTLTGEMPLPANQRGVVFL